MIRILFLLLAVALPAALHAQSPAWLAASRLALEGPPGSGILDADGSYVLAGTFRDSLRIGTTRLTSAGNEDVYVAKFTATGSPVWVRQLGAAANERAIRLRLDAAGNVYVLGTFSGTVVVGANLTMSSPGEEMFIVRYSSSGTPEWVRQGNASLAFTRPTDLVVSPNGQLLVSAVYTDAVTVGPLSLPDPGTGEAAFLLTLATSTGNVEQLTQLCRYPRLGVTTPTAIRLAVSPTNEVYVLGTYDTTCGVILPASPAASLTSRGRDDVFVAQYSSQGTLRWYQEIKGPGADTGGTLRLDNRGNLYVAGSTTNGVDVNQMPLPYAGGSDGWLVSYTPAGTLRWTQGGVSPSSDAFTTLAFDSADNMYLAGSFIGTMALGPNQHTSQGGSDILVSSFTSQGQFRWSQTAGGPGTDVANTLDFANGNRLYVGGYYGATCSFGTTLLQLQGTWLNRYLAQISPAVLSAVAARTLRVSVFPLPGRGQLQISGIPAGSQVTLYDAVGRQVRASTLAASGIMSVEGVACGLYTLRATDQQGRSYSARLEVE